MKIIDIIDFKKNFGNKTVHNGVSLQVIKGECLGLVGGSGIGKSVLLRAIIGLEKADAGEIYFYNTKISDLSEDDIQPFRKKIAYAFQGGALFDSLSVFENLAFPLREHSTLSENQIFERVNLQLDEVGLSGQGQLMPSQLSGGMQKRVGLARALLLEPEVILFDEPTAGLDPANTHRIQDIILKTKSKGITSILVTHDMPVAEKACDRIALLSGGKIQAIATKQEWQSSEDHLFYQFARGELT
jgi:phospholipid/cholesterol/gamma-HCH transport system ATP-binding protein